MKGEDNGTYLRRHVVQRVEVGIEVRDEQLCRNARQQRLRVRPQVGRDRCALTDGDLHPDPRTNEHSSITPRPPQNNGLQTYMLQQPERKHRQHLHIVRRRQLPAAAAASHSVLIRSEDIRELVRNGVPCVL